MVEYKGVEIQNINDYEQPVYVDNKNIRTEDTEKYFELALEETNDWAKSNGVIISEEYVQFVDCPVCGSSVKTQLFIKWGFKIAACNRCQHGYVENQLHQLKLKELYASSELDKQFQTMKH